MGKFDSFQIKFRRRALASNDIITGKNIIDGLVERWGELEDNLEDDEDLKEELITHFNGVIDGEDDLGNILTGEIRAFTERVKYLDDDVLEEYAQKI